MVVADSHDVAQTRSVSGLQHGFLQLRRRMEGSPSEGVATKYVIPMTFSTETIVAAAVGVVFALLTFGAIAREQGEPVRSVHNAYIAASNVNLSQVAASETDVLGIY